MRLEVRSINMNRNKGTLRREDIGVFDADTGIMIKGVQEIRLKFSVKEFFELELDVYHDSADSLNNEFKVVEEENFKLLHQPTGKTLDSLSFFSIQPSHITIRLVDFDANIDILRPFKEYNSQPRTKLECSTN